MTINSNFKAKIPDLVEKFSGTLVDLAEHAVAWLIDYLNWGLNWQVDCTIWKDLETVGGDQIISYTGKIYGKPFWSFSGPRSKEQR